MAAATFRYQEYAYFSHPSLMVSHPSPHVYILLLPNTYFRAILYSGSTHLLSVVLYHCSYISLLLIAILFTIPVLFFHFMSILPSFHTPHIFSISLSKPTNFYPLFITVAPYIHNPSPTIHLPLYHWLLALTLTTWPVLLYACITVYLLLLLHLNFSFFSLIPSSLFLIYSNVLYFLFFFP